MYPGKLDDKGRLKLPAVFLEYFGELGEKKLFVTSINRRTAQIYPTSVWRKNKKLLEAGRNLSGCHSRPWGAYVRDCGAAECEGKADLERPGCAVAGNGAPGRGSMGRPDRVSARQFFGTEAGLVQRAAGRPGCRPGSES